MYSQHDHAKDLAYKEGEILVAHGGLGVQYLSSRDGSFLYETDFGMGTQNKGHRSKIISVSVNQSKVVFGVDVITQPRDDSRAFNGVIKYDGGNYNNFSKHAYNYRRAGVLAYARTSIENNTLYINNLGQMQILDLRGLDNSVVPVWASD